MPVAVNIRGTSGSGKSHLVREVMKRYDKHDPVHRDGRRRPYLTTHAMGWERGDEVPVLVVPGRYDTPCGGCDLIKTVDEVYKIVRTALQNNCNALYEGIMVMEDVRRAVELSKDHQLVVVHLTTPLDMCLEAVRARRRERGDTRPLDPTNTITRDKRCRRGVQRLKEAGVDVREATRGEALDLVLELLDA